MTSPHLKRALLAVADTRGVSVRVDDGRIDASAIAIDALRTINDLERENERLRALVESLRIERERTVGA